MSSTEQHVEPTESSTKLPESHDPNNSSPMLPIDPPITIMPIKSLVIHDPTIGYPPLGSLALVATLLGYLDGHQFYLERQPEVHLANRTSQSQQLPGYNLLQPEVTSSVCLPRDPSLVLSEPTTRFHPGLYAGASTFRPLVTGSISWLPSNKTIDLPDRPDFTLAGYPQDLNVTEQFNYMRAAGANLGTTILKNFNVAWSQAPDPFISKRVIASAARLGIGSTFDSVLLPYFAATQIEWLPEIDNNSLRLLNSMQINNDRLLDQLNLTAAAALIVNETLIGPPTPPPPAWYILINVGTQSNSKARKCNLFDTFLPANSTIPVFTADIYSYRGIQYPSCFAYAKVSYIAAHGICSDCRVGSLSTVQNDTEIELVPDYGPVRFATHEMSRYITQMTPLQDSLPDPRFDLEVYAIAFLTRLFSASWNAWADASADQYMVTTGYKPAVSTLTAKISRSRVYGWLALQLSLTFAGAGFIWLQSTSRYPLLGDTAMVAFNIDSTEVSKTPPHEQEKRELLGIEPKGDGWKVIVVN
ncbi:hypothetical protein RHS01_08276 [Rhizoctonia solani]|uniref:Uncharacterized protein n=1 Tax=Rhizoctonia solani TaxID=456999 RepID=A0A8H7M267_9AGAM|nr:hypothetical protein RHS01_08276 [Rhizoctonia solani]